MVDVRTVYLSTGCNTSSQCLTVSKSRNLVLFASDSELISGRISDNKDSISKLVGVSSRQHLHSIKCVKRCKGTKADYLVSGSSDGRIVVWYVEDDLSFRDVYITDLPKGSSVGSVAGYCSGDELIVVAAWVGGTGHGVEIFTLSRANNEWTQSSSQSLEGLGNAFALSADFRLVEDVLLLALGTSKRIIEVFHRNPEKKTFSKGLSLPAHSDWIHALSFEEASSSTAVLASAGQDNYVKLWRFEKESKATDPNELTVTKNNFEVLSANGSSFNLEVRVEAVLSGHEDWVHSVAWDSTGKRLLSASSDKAVIIWTEAEEGGVWTDSVRLGIVGGQAAGFYSAEFTLSGKQIVASSYYGGIHGWIVSEEDEYLWEPLSIPSGHSTEVRDVAWEPKGGCYVMSVGKDQTTRVHAPVKGQDAWAEIGRPQLHGHDMQCLAAVDAARFVSGAEEKIFRAFGAPQTFANSLEAISGVDKEKVFAGCSLCEFGARVPALGLSNKAMDEGDKDKEDEESDGRHWEEAAYQANPDNLTAAPTEDCLMQNTLWPELHKLYGHGYEVYAIASNPNGTVLATTCKASDADHATILFWSTEDWTQRGQASGHKLTVTQLEWSPDGKTLVSVSRDRTVVVYVEAEGNVNGFNWNPVWTSGKEHSRIIWSCAWMADSQHFVTASRDQKVIVWHLNSSTNSATPLASFKANQPVTAVAVNNTKNVSDSTIVCGMQDGSLQMVSIDGTTLVPIGSLNGDRVKGVDAAVLRLRFRPCPVDDVHQLLAVCGTDCKLRILEVTRKL